MKNAMRIGLATLALSGFVIAAHAAGTTIVYKAALSGASEVPANTTKGTGEVTATYDAATKTLSWNGTYSALTGPVTAAHFHGPAEPGKNSGVLVPAPATTSPFMGTMQIDEAKAADLASGKVYFNVYTAANPSGEIRGQLEAAK